MPATSRFLAVATALLLPAAVALAQKSLPEPGPENSGLRLRFHVVERLETSGHDVRLDLINVTDEPVTVSADWPREPEGDFQDYVEMAASIRTHPEIMLWGVQVMADLPGKRESKQTLAARETLTVKWTAKGRRLKNRVIRPNEIHNPYFPTDGLYGTHAELKLMVTGPNPGNPLPPGAAGAGRHAILLRSNEQLVSIGKSSRTPKPAISRLIQIGKDRTSGTISPGSLHGVVVGDEFLVRTGMSVFWRLVVTHVGEQSSTVSLQPQAYGGESKRDLREHEYPQPGAAAGLIPPGTISWSWMWNHQAAAEEVVPISQVAARLGSLIPDWKLQAADEEPGVRVPGDRGFRVVLRRTWKQFLQSSFPQQEAAPPAGPFEWKHEDWEFVLVPIAGKKRRPPVSLKSEIGWRDSNSPWHTRDICLGEGHGYVWFTHGTIPFQDVVRSRLRLTGGDDPLQLAADGLLVNDEGTFTANSVPYILARFGDKALPYIETAIRKARPDDRDALWKAVTSLVPFRSGKATTLLLRLFAADNPAISRPASYTLIHEPFRIAAKPAYLKMLRDRQYVDRVSRAIVEFQWAEAIPILDGIIDRPEHLNQLKDALYARRSLEGQPVDGKLIEAEQILRQVAYRNTKAGPERVESARQLLIGSDDSEFANLAGISLATYVAKGDTAPVNGMGLQILKARPRESTVRFLEALIAKMDQGRRESIAVVLESVLADSR